MDEDDLSRPWVSNFSNRDVSGCGEICRCFRTPSERSLTKSWTFTSLGLTLAFNLSEEEIVSLDLQPAWFYTPNSPFRKGLLLHPNPALLWHPHICGGIRAQMIPGEGREDGK